jgi:hypothetical protein
MSWGQRTHRQARGEYVSDLTFTDSFRADRIADPEEAYQECVAAHRYATRQLETATGEIRRFCLMQERKRLADIAWRLKRRC